MTTKTIALSAISIQLTKPNTAFGALTSMPIGANGRMLARGALTGIPANAVITSAKLQIWGYTAWAGTRTVKVRRLDGTWNTSTYWYNQPPTSAGTEVSVTRSAIAANSLWEFDVLIMVAAWFAGTQPNNGFLVMSTETTQGVLRGQTTTPAPQLVVEYTVPALVPTALHPSGGAVSKAKPTLTFQAPTDTASVQVQIDSAADATTPDFDSGEVAATGGLLDLSAFSSVRTAMISKTSGSATITAGSPTFSYLDVGQSITGTGIPAGATITAVASATSATLSANATSTGAITATFARVFLGLADGSSTQWRARVKNGMGWSDWSGWVPFSRAAWKTLTVTSPASTTEDPTPVITATYGGTITAWTSFTTDPNGHTVEISGWVPGSVVSYGTTRALASGSSAYVQIHDDVLRDATPGDPDYLMASATFTVAPSGTPAAPSSVSGAQNGISPGVVLTGARTSGVPDQLVISRDNVVVARLDGGDVFTGTNFTWTDWTAPMNTQVVYRFAAVVNGHWSTGGPTVTITPTCDGVWLIDPDTAYTAVIFGDDDQEQTQPELAVVHTPISASDTNKVVRRRLARYPRQGVISGTLVDAEGTTASASEGALRAWIAQDAGHVYRLVLGNQNDPVIIGDVDLSEVSENGGVNGRVLDVSLNWWWAG